MNRKRKNMQNMAVEEGRKFEQLDMDLKSSRFELYYKLKRMVSRIEKNYTLLPFWRNALIWAAIMSVISVSIISTVMIFKSYSGLPTRVPLIYNAVDEGWESYPKIYLYVIPLLLFAVGIVNIRILQKVYYMNKKLTLMICMLITVLYLIELVALNHILLLVST